MTPPSRRRTREALPLVQDDDSNSNLNRTKRSRPGSYQNLADSHNEEAAAPRRKGPNDTNKIILNPDPRMYPRVLNEWKPKSCGHHILIVGGGIAGLTAARELKRMGYGVTVIEARERIGKMIALGKMGTNKIAQIGGRIHTITSDDLKLGFGIDIGASFVYGSNSNPFVELCRETVSPILIELPISFFDLYFF